MNTKKKPSAKPTTKAPTKPTTKAPTKTATKPTKKPAKQQPASSTRVERRALRTGEILATALALIEEGGLAALTTTELARRNGAALGALYRFFPSRQSVIAALQADALAQLHGDLTKARDRARAVSSSSSLSAGAALWAPFIALADVWFAEQAQHPARFRLIDEILSAPDPVYDDDDARALEAGAQAVLALLSGCVDDVVDARGANAAILARRFPLVLWAGLHGVSHFQKRDRLVNDDLRAARVAGSLLVLLLKGLGATDDDLDAAFAAMAPRALRR